VWDTFTGGHDDMDVGSPAGDGMQRPATKRALLYDRILNSMPLMSRQYD
jgi:hypothetical protein